MEQPSFERLLEDAARRVGVSLTPAGLALAALHAQGIAEWRDRVNLTAATSLENLVERHFLEGIQAAHLLPPAPAGRPLSVADIGSGAGFPGLTLRITRPDLQVTLVEPRTRRAAFLTAMAVLQPPPTPQVVVTDLRRLKLPEPLDVLTFRAVKLVPAEMDAVLAREARIIAFPGDEETRKALSGQLAPFGFTEEGSAPISGGRRVVAWRRGRRQA